MPRLRGEPPRRSHRATTTLPSGQMKKMGWRWVLIIASAAMAFSACSSGDKMSSGTGGSWRSVEPCAGSPVSLRLGSSPTGFVPGIGQITSIDRVSSTSTRPFLLRLGSNIAPAWGLPGMRLVVTNPAILCVAADWGTGIDVTGEILRARALGGVQLALTTCCGPRRLALRLQKLVVVAGAAGRSGHA
jgi:hypothetical protein